MLTTCQYHFHCLGVITIDTELAGTNLRMLAISAKSSEVAASEFDGAMYVPSNIARDAGVVAV